MTFVALPSPHRNNKLVHRLSRAQRVMAFFVSVYFVTLIPAGLFYFYFQETLTCCCWRFFFVRAVSRCARECARVEWHFYWHNLWLGEVASARRKMECLLNNRLLASRSSEGKASLHFFLFVVNIDLCDGGYVCECVLMWVREFLNRFTTVFVRFLTSSLLYNTILAYCLTWSHCFFSVT